MKIITDLRALKRGDTVIIKDAKDFDKRGLFKLTGDVFNIEYPEFTIKCQETKEIERVNFVGAKVYLIDGH